MPERIMKWNRTYEMIETSCRTTHHCVPCTYPNCRRNLRLRKTAARSFGKGWGRLFMRPGLFPGPENRFLRDGR